MPEQFYQLAIDSAIRKRITSARKIRDALDQLRPAPGRSKVRVEELIGVYLLSATNFEKIESVLEARILRVVLSVTNMEVVTQYQCLVSGNRYRIDIAIPEIKLAIEVDGFKYHSGRHAFDSDKKRQNALVGAGWNILRFTASQTDDEIRLSLAQFLSIHRVMGS